MEGLSRLAGLAPLGLVYAALFVAPMAVLVALATRPSGVVGAEGPLANAWYLLTRPVYLEAGGRTLAMSLAAAVGACAVGLPTALALRSLGRRVVGGAMVLLVLPIAVGPLVGALVWLSVLSPATPVGTLAGALGVRLVGHELGAVIGLAAYGFPFVCLVVLAALARLDPDIEGAARVDGADDMRVFIEVTWPSLSSAVAAGGLLVMLLGLSAYVIPLYLAGGARPVLTTVVAQYVLGTFDWPLAATAGLLLIVLSALVGLVWPRPPAYATEGDDGWRRARASRLALAWLAIVTACGLAPMLSVARSSVSALAQFPGPVEGWSGRWYSRVLQEPEIAEATVLSLCVATSATTLATLVSVPAAVAMARQRSGILAAIASAPLAAPQLVLGLATLGLVSAIGVGPAPWGLVAAHAAFVTPVVLRALSASVERQDPAILEAAMVDGAGPLRRVVSIILPLARDALAGGAALAFALSFANVPLSLFLATPSLKPLPVLMLSRLETRLDPALAALTTLLVLGGLAVSVVAARARAAAT